MNLENLLKTFAASAAGELKIEPDSKPFLVSGVGKQNVSEITFTAATISQLISPLIPLDDKLRLPGVPQIMFRHTNEHGLFNVTVAKSAAGLTVSFKKIGVPTIDSKTNAPAETALIETLKKKGDQSRGKSNKLFSTDQQFKNQSPALTVHQPSSNSSDAAAVSPMSVSDLLNDNLHLPTNVVDLNQPLNINISAVEFDIARPISKTNWAGERDVAEIIEISNVINETQPVYEPEIDSPLVETQNSDGQILPRRKIDQLFHRMAERKASDLHLSVSMPPMIRIDGKIEVLEEKQEALSPDALQDLLFSIMPEKNREEFERRHDTDFAYEIKGLARFRANIFMDRKGMGGVFRIIPTKILTLEQLGLSDAIRDLCNLSKGLVVVTGPTGSGKSTTLAAMVDYVNRNRADHIITIEDPIEFVHENQKCLLNQREVHNHTDSFKDALRAALREDPDILLVGEMRDLETVSIAIETAETGHLVFGTLHTTTAPSTIDRIIDQFPADRQQQIRVMLSESLKGVISQTLLPKTGGGRVAAIEILIVTPAISNLIREGKTFQIASAMQTGKQQGMVVLNDALVELVKKGDVEPHHAYLKAVDKSGLESLFKRHGIG